MGVVPVSEGIQDQVQVDSKLEFTAVVEPLAVLDLVSRSGW